MIITTHTTVTADAQIRVDQRANDGSLTVEPIIYTRAQSMHIVAQVLNKRIREGSLSKDQTIASVLDLAAAEFERAEEG